MLIFAPNHRTECFAKISLSVSFLMAKIRNNKNIILGSFFLFVWHFYIAWREEASTGRIGEKIRLEQIQNASSPSC